MNKTKVTTFVGTRPEIIRLSSIIKKFDELFDHRLVHTGQNPDHELRKIFFKDLNLREPNFSFKDSDSTLGNFIANSFIETERELNAYKPDALVLLGDTNSSLCAIIAKRMGIPIYHLEAGNRSFDSNVPEEINRRIVDHIADFNFPYSELARANLISEGIHPRKIYLMGSPLPEVFNSHLPRILKSKILEELNLEPRNYFLVSAHRQENVDSKDRLATLLSALERMIEEFNIPIMVSTHPRTKIKLANLNKTYSKKIIFHKPFGFLDYNKLQMNARGVLSDSGTVSEESVILGFPAVTIRDSMERPEALESGSIIMCGISEDRVIEAIRIVEKNQRSKIPPKEYEIPDTSTRIANVLVSTVHQHSFWNGIRKYEK